MSNLYSTEFYGRLSPGSTGSAEVILPLVLNRFSPCSVVDVGCGAGAWLAAARRLGIVDTLGLDGDWVDTAQLQIPEESFRQSDLAQEDVDLGRRFDLCMSLEVAEHLPPERASSFVAMLCGFSDVVVFSAAVPSQGGMGHITERWPSFWAALFAAHGYGAQDLIRPAVWDDERVEPWYRQNTLVYVSGESNSVAMLDVMHPFFVERRLAGEGRFTATGVVRAGSARARIAFRRFFER